MRYILFLVLVAVLSIATNAYAQPGYPSGGPLELDRWEEENDRIERMDFPPTPQERQRIKDSNGQFWRYVLIAVAAVVVVYAIRSWFPDTPDEKKQE